ncbi:UNVERIFIED_CONTAM: hypothetical protein K2H54_073878 [Gekko kuhli]
MSFQLLPHWSERLLGSYQGHRMAAKKAPQKKGGPAGKAPRQVPPTILSTEDEGGPSLQDLAAKIEALERAKVVKRKPGGKGKSGAAPPPSIPGPWLMHKNGEPYVPGWHNYRSLKMKRIPRHEAAELEQYQMTR